MKRIKMFFYALLFFCAGKVCAQYPSVQYTGQYIWTYTTLNIPMIESLHNPGEFVWYPEVFFEDIFIYDGIPSKEAHENATVRWAPIYNWDYVPLTAPDFFPVIPWEETDFPGLYIYVNDAVTGQKKMIPWYKPVYFEYTVFVYEENDGNAGFFSGGTHSSLFHIW